MKDDEPTPEEQRQAEALARALEGEPGEAPPPEALEAAAFLRFSRSGDLDPGPQSAVAERVRRALRPARRRWLWLAAPLAAGATAAALLGLGLESRAPRAISLSPERAPLSWPAPSAGLLAAQAQVARGRREALTALDDQMRAYRRALFEQLRERDSR